MSPCELCSENRSEATAGSAGHERWLCKRIAKVDTENGKNVSKWEVFHMSRITGGMGVNNLFGMKNLY